MDFSKVFLLLSILLILLVGCNNVNKNTSTSNPTPKEYLKYDNADIFFLNEHVFSNAQNIEWVTELEYELGEQIGEIKKLTDKASKFKNGTANKLPIGTKIFETDTPVYIAIVDGREIPYLEMIEG